MNNWQLLKEFLNLNLGRALSWTCSIDLQHDQTQLYFGSFSGHTTYKLPLSPLNCILTSTCVFTKILWSQPPAMIFPYFTQKVTKSAVFFFIMKTKKPSNGGTQTRNDTKKPVCAKILWSTIKWSTRHKTQIPPKFQISLSMCTKLLWICNTCRYSFHTWLQV